MKKHVKRSAKILSMLIIPFLIISCETSDNPITPYVGSPVLSEITIEEGTFTPKITWVGGYTSVMGINRGGNAALDTSLVWLVYSPGNSLRYSVKYGVLPEGAQDLTINYGGQVENQLIEDRNYTFWVMKEEAWKEISSLTNKIIRVDSSSKTVVTAGDTINVPVQFHTQLNKNFDNYINVYEITTRGPLADLTILETDTSNSIFIKWIIKQAGYTDSTVAAIGLVEGTQYDLAKIKWEMYSEGTINNQLVYGKNNVIASPINPVEQRPGTKIFYDFPLTGLERNSGYYVWIAGKNWNGVDRLRTTPDYAYVTFKTR